MGYNNRPTTTKTKVPQKEKLINLLLSPICKYIDFEFLSMTNSRVKIKGRITKTLTAPQSNRCSG
jgi:hypothetical protein